MPEVHRHLQEEEKPVKNNQQKNRNHQPRQNQQPQQPIPAEVLKRLTVLGADINISEGVTIPVPREEYDELVYCSALVDILHTLYETSGKYAMSDLLEKIFKDDEKEDK